MYWEFVYGIICVVSGILFVTFILASNGMLRKLLIGLFASVSFFTGVIIIDTLMRRTIFYCFPIDVLRSIAGTPLAINLIILWRYVVRTGYMKKEKK